MPKRHHAWSVLALLTGATTSVPAFAAATTHELLHELDVQQAHIDQQLQRLDRQQDGIDRMRTRLQVAIHDAPARFRALDKDHNGRLTPDEVANEKVAMPFSSMDANNDGAVSLAEWEDRLPPRWLHNDAARERSRGSGDTRPTSHQPDPRIRPRT